MHLFGKLKILLPYENARNRKIRDYYIHVCYQCSLFELYIIKVNLRYCEIVKCYADYIKIVKDSTAVSHVP